MDPHTTTPRVDPTAPPMNEPAGLGDIIKDLRDETTLLLKEEVALAKTEMSEKASCFGKNAVAIAAGAMVGYSALVVLLVGLGFLVASFFHNSGMEIALANFLGMLIVALVVGVIAAVMVTKAKKNIQQESVAPEKTIDSLKEDKAWAQQKLA